MGKKRTDSPKGYSPTLVDEREVWMHELTALIGHGPMVLGALKAELYSRDLHAYIKDVVWPVLEPGRQFVDNWHIHAICEHLMAVTTFEIKQLLVTMPPRFMKSLLISAGWPTWVWTKHAERSFLGAAYQGELAVRDAVKARRVIESDLYQAMYGERFRLTTDQNVKSNYENSKRGTRQSTSVGGVTTGLGGDYRLVDDPHNVLEADSDVARETTLVWWKEAFSSRYNDPVRNAVVLVQQRIHEDDLAGYVVREEDGWVHLNIPMRFEEEYRCKTIYTFGKKTQTFEDPRTKERQLAWPDRFPEDEVRKQEKKMGTYAREAQLQQRPSPRGGAIFIRDHWRYYTCKPTELDVDEVILSVDAAFKDTSTSDFVACHAWGLKKANSYLMDRVTDRMGFNATMTTIKQMYKYWVSKHFKVIAILIEDKANGPAIIETMRDQLAGITPVTPQGGKIARARASQPTQESGNIWLPDADQAPWVKDYVEVCAKFPAVSHDDDVDAMTQAIIWRLTRENYEEDSPAPVVLGGRTT